MVSFLPEPSPAPVNDVHRFLSSETDDEDADTASQRSISLSSPPSSPLHSVLNDLSRHHDSDSQSKRESHAYTVDTDFGSDVDDGSMFGLPIGFRGTPDSSAAPSIHEEPKEGDFIPPTRYPPSIVSRDDSASISSLASGSSRKARPESLLVPLPDGPIILGIALVDFNHLIGPHIEFSKGEILEDEEIAKILPFLALPDGAHLSTEDYTYFHLVPPGPNPTTIFGISCNKQIATSALLVKGADVTRSIVQKAVVVLASKPVFGPIRAKLGVVTTALFNQRDFTDSRILDDFASSLELSIRGQLTESALYMGTNLRELVHIFRQRILVLVKALMLQKRIMFYGHPVERLCTYQYSLVSLLPGLLQTLDDCGSPPLASRAPTLSRATSLRTSDYKSMMAYMGLPLDIFGWDAFFQPYLPLQQLDMLKESKSWLCGCTNSIVTHQKEIDLLINIETGLFEFRDPNLERSAGLTAADRKWMDDIIQDVNEGWNDDNPTKSSRFKGGDDYLRTKFEEYIFAALSSVRYQDFVAKGEGGGVMITGGSGGDSTSTEDFNPLWISEFKQTNAYGVWERITDPVLFDIIEPRHPCNEKPSVVTDISIRLQEGIQDLRLEQQLAPAREAVARTFTAGSTNFFKAVEGVRGRWAQRANSESAPKPTSSRSSSNTPVEVSRADLSSSEQLQAPSPPVPSGGLRPFSLLSRNFQSTPASPPPPQSNSHSSLPPFPSPSRQTLAAWGTGIGSFLSTRLSRQPSEGGSVPSSPHPDGATLFPVLKMNPTLHPVLARAPLEKAEHEESSTPQVSSTKSDFNNTTSSGGRTPVGVSEHPPSPSTPTRLARSINRQGVSAIGDPRKGDHRGAHVSLASNSEEDRRTTLEGGHHFDEEDAYTGMAL